MRGNRTPENLQQPAQPANDLGQMCISHRGKEWVVVEYAGQDDEYILAEFDRMQDAARYCEKQRPFYNNLDVMRRTPDGHLTTEY